MFQSPSFKIEDFCRKECVCEWWTFGFHELASFGGQLKTMIKKTPLPTKFKVEKNYLWHHSPVSWHHGTFFNVINCQNFGKVLMLHPTKYRPMKPEDEKKSHKLFHLCTVTLRSQAMSFWCLWVQNVLQPPFIHRGVSWLCRVSWQY